MTRFAEYFHTINQPNQIFQKLLCPIQQIQLHYSNGGYVVTFHSGVEFWKTGFNSFPNPAAHLHLSLGPCLSLELGKMHPSSIKTKVQSFHLAVYLHDYLASLYLPLLPLSWIVSMSSLHLSPGPSSASNHHSIFLAHIMEKISESDFSSSPSILSSLNFSQTFILPFPHWKETILIKVYA